MIEENSALDFSRGSVGRSLQEQDRIVINADGKFARKSSPEAPVRFLMASLGFAPVNGGFPSHATVDLYVNQLRLRGYNMARLDYIEDTLMHKRSKDFDFDPEQLDRLHYLLAALRKAGIYYILSGASGDNGAYGNIQNRWQNNKNLRLGLYFDEQRQAHWKRLITTMFAGKNAYTGELIMQDPAFAGMILVNEGGLEFINRSGGQDELKPVFNQWLIGKYQNSKNLAQAWGGVLGSNELVEKGTVSLPTITGKADKRMADAQRFYLELENKTYGWMKSYVQDELHYPGLLTAFNNWHSPAAQMARGSLSWVDMHNYAGLPSLFTQPGSSLKQNSILQDDLKYIRELAGARQWGKPYTVSEYGQVFWNKYRYESSLAIPAFAGFQDWDMISQHAEAIGLSYANNTPRRNAMYPFVIAYDPIARVTEVMSYLLYKRKDVKPYQQSLNIQLPQVFSLEKSSFLGNIPGDLSRLSLLYGIGIGEKSKASATLTPDTTLMANAKASKPINISGLIEKTLETANLQRPVGVNYISDRLWKARLASLDTSSTFSIKKSEMAKDFIYVADNNQITLNRPQGWLRVLTDTTEAVVFNGSTIPDLNFASLKVENVQNCLFAISAIDDNPLSSSKRVLMVLASDARNSGMSFKDKNEEVLAELGQFPVMLNRIKLTVSLKDRVPQEVYVLNQRGQRTDQLKFKALADQAELEIDTGTLSHGPTTFFELIF